VLDGGVEVDDTKQAILGGENEFDAVEKGVVARYLAKHDRHRKQRRGQARSGLTIDRA
jgi:hypothetical protein